MSESKKKTTISLSAEIKKRLNLVGHKGESYDEILSKLLDTFEGKKSNSHSKKFVD